MDYVSIDEHGCLNVHYTVNTGMGGWEEKSGILTVEDLDLKTVEDIIQSECHHDSIYMVKYDSIEMCHKCRKTWKLIN